MLRCLSVQEFALLSNSRCRYTGKHDGDGLLKFKIFFLSFSLQKPNVNYVPINLDYVFYFFSSANELFSVAGGGLHYL